MNRNTIAAILFGVILLLVGLAGAFYLGVGPAPGGESGDSITDFPTATPTDGAASTDEGSSTDGGSATTATPHSDPFSFTIDETKECGQTCRDVTATLHNQQTDTATGVTVYTRIFAGEDNTNTDDTVWEGKEEIGTIDAGASHTTTERVELSLQEARKIDQNGGWITILTTVESDDTTVTFKDSEQVA